MRSISFGFAVLATVLMTACALDNPTAVSLPDAGPCGTMGAACCPQVASSPTGARTVCRSAGLTCSAGSCVACGAPGQPCCAAASTADAGRSMDAGAAAGTCTGAGVACLVNTCVDCSGPDRAICNGACVSLTTEQNCGACGTTCATAERCVRPAASGVDAGVVDAGTLADGGARVAFCQIICPPGQVLCGSTCRDLNTDPNNCRTCGNQCNVPGAVAGCAGGACTLASCREGFGNCDSNAANGCETATGTDATNCGVCGNRCSFANAAATCAAGLCVRGACNAGFADCDGNPANGCEVNVAMGDINNCGACRMACPAPGPGVTALCAMNMCRTSIVVCGVGLGNCDGADGNGCETSTLGNVMNCGLGGAGSAGCGVACPSTGGTPSCVGGSCSIACNAGLGDCDATRGNGCETNTNTSVAHCGGCNRPCSVINGTAGCAAGACTIASCNTGFANCDGIVSNGCEVNINADLANCGACSTAGSSRACPGGQTCQGGTCMTSCLSPQVACSGVCRDLRTDNNNCGMCGRVCPGGQICSNSVCATSCSATQTNCSGICRELATDNNNCGMCGRVCPGGQICTGSACVTSCSATQTACTAGAVTTCRDLATDNTNCGACGTVCTGGTSCQNRACACPAGQTSCSGTCRALQTDNNNCGVCGRICGGGQTCVSGACTTTCSAAQTDCSGTCRDLATDNTNCGACGAVCTGGTACQGRSCVCPAGQTNCSGTCRALQTDNANCGVCGTVCPGGQVCSAGVCTGSCAAPTTLCSGFCRDLQNDPSNCNACGAVCTRASGVAGCAAGVCTLAACNSGFGNCDGNATNGCEVNTATSVTNCGVCGNSCQFANAAASCVAGRCTRGTCTAGFANCDGVDSNGCEVNTVAGDVNNCGGCTIRCPTPPIGSIAVCANSACTTSSVSCGAGTADCDGAFANGCEVNTNTVGNCGVCGRVCVSTNGTATCPAGLCGITCSAGFGNCNGLLSDGCETNTNTSPTNCGACNTICSLPNATAGCAAGACTIASCNTGFANCDGVASNGCEVNINSSTAHCGACSTAGSPRACAAGQLCSAGACVTTCGSGQTNCSGACRDTLTDPDGCGACGTVCSGTGVVSRTCGGGACNGTCSAGRANCDNNLQSNGCEIDTNTTPTQCGGCGAANACSTSNITRSCVGGSCESGTCAAGFADCNNDKRADGCEINITNNVSNCGGCGATFACPARANATVVCVGSGCGISSCNAGFGNCNLDNIDGCEVPLNNNPNCGACGTICNGGLMCEPVVGMPGIFACQ